jgi:hypothetical protein
VLNRRRRQDKNKNMTYSSSVAVSRRGYGRRNQNSVAFAATAKTLGPVSNTIILLALACLIGLLYLTQVTKTNSYGYSINTLHEQQAELLDQKANLEVSAARLQSLERVANSAVAKGLVATPPSGSIRQ